MKRKNLIKRAFSSHGRIILGLLIEAALMAHVDADGDKGTAKANASYLATGDYYFSNNKFRPFLVAGAGIFTYAKASTENEEPGDISVNSKFGFMARGGFEIFNGIFRI